MEKNFYENKLEFKQIVLLHLKKILDISSEELRDKKVMRYFNNYSEMINAENTQFSYIQSIENLAYILLPYFDDEMNLVYNECIKIITMYGYKLRKIFNDEWEDMVSDIGKELAKQVFTIETKLIYAKKLFVALNLLLKRNDYLKSAVYGEADNEIIEDEGVEE